MNQALDAGRVATDGVMSEDQIRVPELVESLGSGNRLDSMISRSFGLDDPFNLMDDQRALAAAEAIAADLGLQNGLGSIRDVFPSDDSLLENIAKSPLGWISTKNKITNLESQVPFMESEAAKDIRDRMSVMGIVPVHVVGNQIIFAVRVDDQFEQNFPQIIEQEVPKLASEIKNINDTLAVENRIDIETYGIWPVSKASYALISNALVDPVFRNRQSIRSSDAYFVEQAQQALFAESGVTVRGFSEIFPNDSFGAAVSMMHFEPFIAVQEKIKAEGAAADSKADSEVAALNVGSAFDNPRDSSMEFLYKRSLSAEFLPLKIEYQDNHRPKVYLGFKAYQSDEMGILLDGNGSFRKADLEDIKYSLETYAQVLKGAVANLGSDFSISDIVLVPIPNDTHKTLFEHLDDSVKRKNTLKIFDGRNGILNYQQLIKDAVNRGAQDVYVHIGRKGPSIRFAIGDNIVEAGYTYSPQAAHNTIISSMRASSHVNDFRIPVAGSLVFEGASPKDYIEWEAACASNQTPRVMESGLNIYPRELEGVSLRFESMPSKTGLAMVVRIHRMQKSPPKLTELGLRPEAFAGIQKIIDINSGLIIFCAPTGCGKSTLMAAILSHKNDPSKAIMTIENPVEFYIDGLFQFEVNKAAGRTQEALLEGLLRMAPGTIMLGEIRNFDDANTALAAGMTGHLVTTTVHTNDAPEAILRLNLLGIDKFFLNSALSAVISQRLIPQFIRVPHMQEYKADPSIVVPYDCTKELEALIGRQGVFQMPVIAYKPRDPDAENARIFSGRVPVNEIIIPTPEVKDLLARREGWDMTELTDLLRGQEDFQPMVVGGIRWVLEGRTSLRALYGGMKSIPMIQFKMYADEIIKVVEQYQMQGHALH